MQTPDEKTTLERLGRLIAEVLYDDIQKQLAHDKSNANGNHVRSRRGVGRVDSGHSDSVPDVPMPQSIYVTNQEGEILDLTK